MLSLIAFATGGAPNASDSGSKVIAFYAAHSSDAQTSDLLWTVAFVFLVFFAASICTMARRAPDSDGSAGSSLRVLLSWHRRGHLLRL